MASTNVTVSAPQPVDWRSPSDLKRVGKELYAEFKQDKVTSLAAAFAYHTVFAIPALLILTVTLAAVINLTSNIDVTGNLKNLIADRAPGESQALLNKIVDNAVDKTSGGAATFGLATTALLALWSGSNAVGALIGAFNEAYGVAETRPWLRKKGLTVGLTLLLAAFINLALALLVFGGRIGSWLAEKAGLGSEFTVVWNLLRLPIGIAAVALVLTLLYYLGPNVEQSFRWVSPGSILATVLWIIATFGISIYLRFSDPGSAYGSVGSVLVLLFFLYVTGIVFLIGAELNALLAKRYDPATIEDLAGNPDADLETRLEAKATAQADMGTAGEAGAPHKRSVSRSTALPPRPSSRPWAGLAVTAGTFALTRGLGRLSRAVRRRRGH